MSCGLFTIGLFQMIAVACFIPFHIEQLKLRIGTLIALNRKKSLKSDQKRQMSLKNHKISETKNDKEV